jgi:hypothetical protein
VTEGRTELLYAAFRERVEYHLLSALVRGKATLGRGDASAQNALAQLEARLKAVGRWIRVHGFVDVATLGQHSSAANLSRKARALISVPGATLESARRVLTAERVEFLWAEHLAATLDEDETAGAIDWVELVDAQGRIIGTGRPRHGSLVWELVEHLAEEECAARTVSAAAMDADATHARHEAPDRAAALVAEASYQRSIVAAASFWRQTYAGLGGPR